MSERSGSNQIQATAPRGCNVIGVRLERMGSLSEEYKNLALPARCCVLCLGPISTTSVSIFDVGRGW